MEPRLNVFTRYTVLACMIIPLK